MTHRQAVGGLVAVALVWGCSFAIIKEALTFISPLMLLAVRFALAGLLVAGSLRGMSGGELRAGMLLGLLFWGGFVFQTTGLQYTTPSRSAFITGMSTPLVPLVYFAAYRTAPRALTLASVALAGIGMYFLTRPGAGSTGINRGDLLTTGCAMLFAGHIVAAGHFARRLPIGRLLALQLGATAVLSLIAAPLVETPRAHWTPGLAAAIVFLSFSAVATFYFQLRAQQVVSPARTALIFTLEPVFAAIASFLTVGERLTLGQWAGAGFILVAMAMPELEGAPGVAAERPQHPV